MLPWTRFLLFLFLVFFSRFDLQLARLFIVGFLLLTDPGGLGYGIFYISSFLWRTRNGERWIEMLYFTC